MISCLDEVLGWQQENARPQRPSSEKSAIYIFGLTQKSIEHANQELSCSVVPLRKAGRLVCYYPIEALASNGGSSCPTTTRRSSCAAFRYERACLWPQVCWLAAAPMHDARGPKMRATVGRQADSVSLTTTEHDSMRCTKLLRHYYLMHGIQLASKSRTDKDYQRASALSHIGFQSGAQGVHIRLLRYLYRMRN